MLEEARRLDHLVSELLELTRLEAGAASLQRERLDWAALCRNAARRLGPRFTAAGLALECVGADEEAPVMAGGRRLEQVVDNLLGNALRYVPAGGTVWLSIEPVEADSAPTVASTPAGGWRLTVADNGPGIEAADLPHVFERFFRARAVRPQGGTGLGLAIVHESVRQHEGRIRAEARPPQGTRFIVELPATA